VGRQGIFAQWRKKPLGAFNFLLDSDLWWPDVLYVQMGGGHLKWYSVIEILLKAILLQLKNNRW